MRRRAVLLGLAAAAALAAGCGGPDHIPAGVITAKHVDPAHTYTTFIPICTTTGGKYPITTCIPYPFFVTDDTDYEITVAGVTGNVSRETYERYEVGQQFPGQAEHPEHNTKVRQN